MFVTGCLKFAARRLIFRRTFLVSEIYSKLQFCTCEQSRSVSTATGLKLPSRRNDVKYSPNTLKNSVDSNSVKKNTLTSEELLEKLMSGLSSDMHQKNRIYKNDLQKVLKKIEELNFSTKKQQLFLLRCCTELLPDESPSNRMNLVEEIWSILKPHTKFTVDHYNELLRVYIANGRTLNVSSFIQHMEPIKPNVTTYELLLRALGEAGDINQATEVISNMKAVGIAATEDIFNSLILCQGKAGNLQNIQEVTTMMQSLKIDKSINTYTAIARAFAWNKQLQLLLEEMQKAKKNNLLFDEKNIIDIVKTLASVGAYETVPKVLTFLPEETLKTPSISPFMQSAATMFVFQNYPMVALEIYKCLPLPSFGPKDDTGLHGRSLVRDCVKASMPSGVIFLITQELMSTGRNPIALQCACEASLQLGKVPLALDLLTRMKQLGMPVRPHYFWPILIHSARSYGEKGIMNTLQTMVRMEITPDYDTLIDYTLPHVSFTSPQNLMKKFLETGLNVTTALTPVMVTLLNTGQTRAASEIAELFQGKIDVEKVIKPLLKGYLTSLDVKSTVYILEDSLKKALQKDKDWVGRFLSEFIQHKKITQDISDFVKLIEALKEKKLKISTAAADYCITRIPEKYKESLVQSIKNCLVEITDERLVDDTETFAHQLPHPKAMDEESLRAHLNELEAKGMNTRGVLRKLLQKYCSQGNLVAAREIAEKCEKEGVFLSAGMKASIFDLHVKLGELELAEISLAELNKSSPNFTLDEYKVIDFATLMVYRKRIDKALDLINEQSKKRRIMGGRNIEMNCWRLLDATAANGTSKDTQTVFQLLTNFGYCKPSNTMLGPLIRVYLKDDKIEEAVEEFQRLAHKYNKTPLKHELLAKILALMSDGHTEDNFLNNEKSSGRLNKLAQVVLNVDRKVHGPSDVQLTLIAALAEVGYKKTLRKLFLDPSVKFHPEALMRRCERFADEKKLAALEVIAEGVKDRRGVDVADIYDLMLDVHHRDDNCHGGLSLWQRMQTAEINPSQKFIQTLCSMLKSNNKDIPAELIAQLEEKNKEKLLN